MINDIFRSFFRTIGRILAYIFIGGIIAYFGSIFMTSSVKAISNVGMFNNLTIADTGNFNSISGLNSVTNKGYTFVNNGQFYYALPSQPNYTYGSYGGSLTQCGIPFLSDSYYGITYYFILNDTSNYLHPYYTKQTPKLGVYDNPSYNYFNFNAETISSGVEVKQLPQSTIFGDYLGYFTFIFKAPTNGTCVNFAFSSSSKLATPSEAVFVGYTYESLGSKPLTSNDIQGALNSSLNNVNNKLDGMWTNISSNIDYTKTQNDQIMKKQDETNEAINKEDSDTTSSKCGVICKLKGIFTGIIELPGKLVTLLIDALKSLFIPSDTKFITDFVDSIESKLGFIAEVPISIIEFGLNLAKASWEEVTSISFPTISIFGYNFWEAKEIDISAGINIFKPFKYITDCLCVVLCARTLNKWRENFTGGSS